MASDWALSDSPKALRAPLQLWLIRSTGRDSARLRRGAALNTVPLNAALPWRQQPMPRPSMLSELHPSGTQCADNRTIAVIDVAAELLDTVFIDPGGAIGKNNRQRLI